MNIIRVEYIGDGRLSMSEDNVNLCYDQHLHLPEHSFVRDLSRSTWYSRNPVNVIEPPSWHGSASGLTYDTVLKSKVLPLTTGKADLLFTWEDGSRTGLMVRDGKVHEADCIVRLNQHGVGRVHPAQELAQWETSGGVRTWTGATNAFPMQATREGTDG